MGWFGLTARRFLLRWLWRRAEGIRAMADGEAFPAEVAWGRLAATLGEKTRLNLMRLAASTRIGMCLR